MQNQSVLYGVIGLLIGVLVTVFVASNAVNNNNRDMMSMMGMKVSDEMMDEREEMMEEKEEMHDGMDISMNEMTDSLKGKTGDEFDKSFIEGMINHHQGAINMANLAKVNAKHDEIKQMADDIISVQSKEIDMMKEWQKMWGY